MNRIRIGFCVIIAAIGIGCSPSLESYIQTVRNGIKTVPHVGEIDLLFTNNPIDHFITQFGFNKEIPVLWNTVVYFGGKYEFTYQVYVQVDYRNEKVIKATSKPKFYLWEVTNVVHMSADQVGALYKSPGYTFGEDDWNKVMAARGDFSVIDIKINTNSPVRGFAEFVSQCRKDRIKVEK